MDGAGTTVTNAYGVTVQGGSAKTYTYDANGNLSSDGTNQYLWDAENRLAKIVYAGTGNDTRFVYDGLGRNTKIIETTGGSVSSTKQFVWCDFDRCEERDATGATMKQFYALGQKDGSTSYFYTTDHLGSIREMIASGGTIEAQYTYSPFGERTKIAGSGPDADTGFAGMYHHARSGLNLTVFRAYIPALGRWLSRDPLGESAGVNLYAYVVNSPVTGMDPLGLQNSAWNTGNFVGHYYDQTGTPVDLGAVGLGGAFENSASVTQAVNNFNNVLSGRAMAIAQENCNKRKRCGDQTVNAGMNARFGEPGTFVGGAGVQDALFAVGHSTFFTRASCKFTFNCSSHSFKFTCNNQFSIQDRFQQPLTAIGYQGEALGTPYPINYSFNRTFSGSGSF